MTAALAVAGITTDGGCRVQREEAALLITPLPESGAFSVRLASAPGALPWPVTLTGAVEAFSEDGASGGKRRVERDGGSWLLRCEPGVFQYRLEAREPAEGAAGR